MSGAVYDVAVFPSSKRSPVSTIFFNTNYLIKIYDNDIPTKKPFWAEKRYKGESDFQQ